MTLYEWDPVKEQSNRRKHGLTFDDAMVVFDDPWALSQHDRIVDGELRWQITGLFQAKALLTVAFTVLEEETNEIIRIISAR